MVGIDRLLHIYDFIRPILDIGLLTFLLFKVYDFIAKTNSIQILKAAVIVAVSFGLAILLDLKTILWLLSAAGAGSPTAVSPVRCGLCR